MATAEKTYKGKRRINLSPAREDFYFIENLAKRDNMPVAKKTMELIKRALIIEEDEYFARIAEKRIAEKNATIDSEDFWKKCGL